MRKKITNTNANGETININLKEEGGEGKIGIIEKIFQKIASMKMTKILKVLFVCVLFTFFGMLAYFCYNVFHDRQNIELIMEHMVSMEEEEDVSNQIRDEVTPQINDNIQKLVYKLHADRVCVFELHNGKKNSTGMGWRYADMTYEKIDEDNPDIAPISTDDDNNRYKDMLLSLYEMPYYIKDNNSFAGSIDDVKLIDANFARAMEVVGGKYMIAVVLRSHYDKKPLGFLCAFYDDTENSSKPSDDYSYELKTMKEDVKTINPLLDLTVQLDKRAKENKNK